MGEVNTSRWALLRERRTPFGWTIEPVDEPRSDCLIAVDPDGRLHLLVSVEIEPPTLPPDLQGIEVRVMESQGTWLDVSARSHHEDLFTMVVNKIIFAIREEGRDPAVSVEATIDELRAALRPVGLDLSVSEQIGLFGELWVLANVLLPNLGVRACHLWSGPTGERHDFVGDLVHVEVKTTTRSEEKHEISRLDQLRAPDGKRLLLASVMLERSIGGESTIADLVDKIIEKLENDGRAIDVFEAGLKNLGWHDGLRKPGSLLRFNLRHVRVFEVEGSFPRLPDDYDPPRGVTAIKYSIDLSARPELCAADVIQILRTM